MLNRSLGISYMEQPDDWKILNILQPTGSSKSVEDYAAITLAVLNGTMNSGNR
jgi:hypothetical protein